MEPWKVIQSLKETNSRLDKESIIAQQFALENTDLYGGIYYCLNSFITFGVKDVHEITTGGAGLRWNEFESLLKKLKERLLTGNAAKEAILNLSSTATIEQWNDWYRLILIKDLKCGVSIRTINKLLSKEEMIPEFSCQLANDASDPNGSTFKKKLLGQKIVDVKLDGARVLTIVNPGEEVRQYTRSGKELLNFTTIKDQFKAVEEAMKVSGINEPMVFDGEVMGKSFQDLMTQLNRKESVDADDSVLYLFDMIPLKDFMNGKCLITQANRRIKLKSLILSVDEEKIPNVKSLDFSILNLSTDAGKLEFENINKKAVENGYEGIMIKDYHASYECKRSYNWIKLKPFITVDLKIVGMEVGEGKYSESLGALICEGYHEGKFISVNVGSGFTDEQRQNIWYNKNLIGTTVEIKTDALTKAKDSETYSLRFPVFVRLRFDK